MPRSSLLLPSNAGAPGGRLGRSQRHPAALLGGLALSAFTLLTACQNDPAGHPTPEAVSPSAAPAAAALPAGYTLYGEPLAAGVESVKLATLLASSASYEGKTVELEADVRRACSRKGCWMELVEGSPEQPSTCRVSFKDYGFFVPTDSQGAHAKLQGVVELKKVSPKHVKHLEEEGATFANKQPDGSATELALVATGVALKK